MERIIAIGCVFIGLLCTVLEIMHKKVFISTIVLSVVLILFGIYLFIRYQKVAFPKKDNNGMKKVKLFENIVLDTPKNLDHIDSSTNYVKDFRKGDELLLSICEFNDKDFQIKVSTTNHKTVGLIPYTLPYRKFIAAKLGNNVTVMAKVFKMTKHIKGNYTVSISIQIYGTSMTNNN